MADKGQSFLYTFKVQSEADAALREYWVNNTVFTPMWFIMAALLIAPWIIWRAAADRERFFELLTYGLLVMVTSLLLNSIGVEADLWEYQVRLVPLLDVFIVYDFSVMPVTYMLAYQYFKTWKSFLAAHAVISAVFAFIAEPLLVWMDVYMMIKWKHIYSFAGYFIIAVLLRLFVMRLARR